MTEHFIFDLQDQDVHHQRLVRSTIVFCPRPQADEIQLRAALKLHFDDRQVPDHVILLGTSASEKSLVAVASSKSVLTSLPRYTEISSPPAVHTLTYGIGGMTTKPADSGALLPSTKSIREHGIYFLFSKYEALLTVGPQFHYEKKSGAHSHQFIRAANILVHGPEIAFVAYWLLPYISDEITHIYTDTPAIHSAVYAAIELKRQIVSEFPTPLISSFGSYEGVDRTPFRGNPLIVVSASTSGNLESKIHNEKGLSRDRIVTLLYGGARKPEGSVLCNLSDVGVTPIENYSPNQCILCDRKVPIVKISGEHFLPETPPVRVELIQAADSSDELRAFAQRFTEREYLRADHLPRRPGEPNRELFIDVRKIFDAFDHPLDRKLARVLQKIPAALQRIIHQSDPGSERLARRVQQSITQYLGREIPIVDHAEILADYQKYILATGTTFVVAGAVSSGKTLLQISQLLRVIQVNGGVQYLIGFSKTRNKEWLNELRSNLQYGDYPGEHECHVLQALQLPQDSTAQLNSWQHEMLALAAWVQRLSDPNERRLLEERKSAIENERREGGLLNHLLWPAPSGSLLTLTKGFALWSHEYDPNHVSQADVYFTVAAVLHRLRQGIGRSPAWSQKLYQRVLLNPSNFSRFNDGVIQASLLRAAHTSELDYSISPDHSQQMADVLETMFQHINLKIGEASLEFLWALATGRLRLSRHDTEEVLAGFGNSNHPAVALLKRMILMSYE